MKTETQGNTTLISAEGGDFSQFVEELTQQFNSYSSANIIVDLTLFQSVSPKELAGFLALAKAQRKAKKSFVIIAETDYDKVSDKLVVVPTLQEAHDMIEMEEIERDLGF